MSGLKNKVVLITGASSGIGAGTAMHFAELGSKVALNGRNVENLKKTADNISKKGVPDKNIFVVAGDISVEDDIKQIVKKTVEHFGQLDVVVNNAAIMATGPILSTSLETLENMWKSNARSPYIMMQEAIPHLKKTKGAFVVVSSIAGYKACAGLSAYGMSKAAVEQLVKVASMEFAADNVRVNCICPGIVETELRLRMGMAPDAYQKYLEHMKTVHPLGRIVDVKDCARAIAFLASDDSAMTTGLCLPVDGGWNMAVVR